MNKIIVIVHNIRSTHNVGALLRTCDSFGVEQVIVSGYTPYPSVPGDTRLPHIVAKNTRDISKSALGAESSINILPSDNIVATLHDLKKQGYSLVGLEQNNASQPLMEYQLRSDVALIIGEERFGLTEELIALCGTILELPMMGAKESLNVAVATGICLYQLRYC